jgi:hypothetical protein
LRLFRFYCLVLKKVDYKVNEYGTAKGYNKNG